MQTDLSPPKSTLSSNASLATSEKKKKKILQANSISKREHESCSAQTSGEKPIRELHSVVLMNRFEANFTLH